MNRTQVDPEIVLQDIVNDILDNRKYRSYTDPEEWLPFFQGMANIVKQISKKNDKIEKESKQLKQKYEQTFADKDELAAKYLDEKERHEKL